MPDIRERLAAALGDRFNGASGTLTWRMIVDELLSLPGIAIVELDSAEYVAKEIQKLDITGDWPWEKLSDKARDTYRRMANAALLTAANAAKQAAT